MRQIYGLVDPRSGELRYVGVSKNAEQRRKRHIVISEKPKTHVQCWIKSLKNLGLEPDVFIIEEVEDSEWADSERFWIDYFLYIGARLTNMMTGGIGCMVMPEESRLKISVANTGKFVGRFVSDETKEKISISNTGKKRSEECKRKMSERSIGNKNCLGKKMKEHVKQALIEANTGRPVSDENKEKLRQRMIGNQYTKGVTYSEERRKSISESLTGRPCSEETRKKIGEANKGNKWNVGRKCSDETKKKISEKNKGRKLSPEWISKIQETRKRTVKPVTEEFRQKMSVVNKENWRKRKEKNKDGSPETILG